MIYNCKRKLKPQSIIDFISNHKEDEDVLVNCKNLNKDFYYKINTFKQFFENENIKIDNKEEITFATEEDFLIISASDYNYWKTKVDKLFGTKENNKEIKEEKKEKEVKIEKSKTSDKVFNVAIGILNEETNKLEYSHEFSGSKKYVIDFLNESYNKLKLQTFNKKPIVFCMNIMKEEKEWKTFEKLVDEGVFVL